VFFRLIILFFFLISVIFVNGCQEGLSPKPNIIINSVSYVNGMIIFKGGKAKFPDSSSCYGIYVAAFKDFPKDSLGFLGEVLKGNVYVKFKSLPYPADSNEFSIEIKDAPVDLQYIVVAMQTDSVNIQAQRAIGVYTLTGDNKVPSAISVAKGKTYNIIINVDFDNLPPQPF
jgi:hypothetical protein